MAETRRISPFLLLPPLLFLGLAVVFFLGMRRDNPDALPSALIGQPAPALNVTAMAGAEPLTQDLLRAPGVKLVNFWASWCGPCRAEHPQLMTLQARGIPIYGVNYKDEPADARRFLTEYRDPYDAIGVDAPGRTGIEWGLYGVPETFVIDGQGRVTFRFPGPITAQLLEDIIMPEIERAAP